MNMLMYEIWNTYGCGDKLWLENFELGETLDYDNEEHIDGFEDFETAKQHMESGEYSNQIWINADGVHVFEEWMYKMLLDEKSIPVNNDVKLVYHSQHTSVHLNDVTGHVKRWDFDTFEEARKYAFTLMRAVELLKKVMEKGDAKCH